MSDGVKISGLPAASDLQGDELIEVVQGGQSRRASLAALLKPTTFMCALVKMSQNWLLNGSVGVWYMVGGFDTPEYDYGSFLDPSIPGILTVPAGVSKVKLSTFCYIFDDSGDRYNISIRKNGDFFVGDMREEVRDGSPNYIGATSVVEVNEGDYFEVWVRCYGDANIGISSSSSWFAIEAIEHSGGAV